MGNICENYSRMAFEFYPTALPGALIVKPKKIGDERGFFMETYKKSDFVANGIADEFVQDNHSRSVQGVLRGLHYQLPPFAQGKLVRCAAGEILDVIMDIRRGSPTFGRWFAEVLSAENNAMLYIPAGFAHGFLTLSAVADVVYKTTAEYAPVHDRGIIWNDPDIAIAWPLREVIVSAKDQRHPRLKDAEVDLFTDR